MSAEALYEQHICQAVDDQLGSGRRLCHFRCEQIQSRVQRQTLRLISPYKYERWKQTCQGLDAHRIESEPPRNNGGRRSSATVFHHLNALSRCNLAEAPGGRPWVIPQRVGASGCKQEAITSGERQRVRNALHAEPAATTRNHS